MSEKAAMKRVIRNGAEWALYWLAVNKPEVMEEAARFNDIGLDMLVENGHAHNVVQAVLERKPLPCPWCGGKGYYEDRQVQGITWPCDHPSHAASRAVGPEG